MFHTLQKSANRVADRLPGLLHSVLSFPPPEAFHLKDATARTFGFDSFADIPKQGGYTSPRDEDLDGAALRKRRTLQAANFDRYAREIGVEIPDPLAFINSWQPSAKRPQRPVLPRGEADRLVRKGIKQKTLSLLADLQMKAAGPGHLIPSEEIGEVMLGLDCLETARLKGKQDVLGFQALCTEAGILATSLVNHGQYENDEIAKHNAALGVALLERLCEDDVYPYSMVSLIDAFTRGWGCKMDYTRALSLAEKVDDLAKKKERFYDNTVDGVFMLWGNRISFLREKAVLLVHGDRVKDAFAPLKEIVEHGHKGEDKGLVVWAARHLLDLQKRGDYAGEFTCDEMDLYLKLTSNLMLQEVKGTYYTTINSNA